MWVADDPYGSVPSAAGVCDALYGGWHHTGESGQLAADLEAAWPPIRVHAHAGRHLQRRIVQYLLGAGIDQFLDIGCGIARHGATHDIITGPDVPPEWGRPSAAGTARLVYVDLDPVTTHLNRRLLHELPWAAAIVGDLRQPHRILNDPVVNAHLDFGRPVAVLALGVLHHLLPDTNPAQILHTLADALMPGSYLAVSHLTTDPSPEGAAAQAHAADLYTRTPTPWYLRSASEVTDLLGCPSLPGRQLVEPGVVLPHRWRPDPDDRSDLPAAHLLAALTHIGPCRRLTAATSG